MHTLNQVKPFAEGPMNSGMYFMLLCHLNWIVNIFANAATPFSLHLCLGNSESAFLNQNNLADLVVHSKTLFSVCLEPDDL